MWSVKPRLSTGREVSFERDGLDASKVCHISAERKCVRPSCRERRSRRSGKNGDVLSNTVALNPRRSNKRGAESWFEQFRGLLPGPESSCSFLSALL
jgi:hypothetical protein